MTTNRFNETMLDFEAVERSITVIQGATFKGTAATQVAECLAVLRDIKGHVLTLLQEMNNEASKDSKTE